MLAPSDFLRAFRPGPYPKFAAFATLSIPLSLMVDKSIWATSLLGVVVRHLFCVFWFIFPSWLSCPLEILKLPIDLLVRGFPGVWKLLLHDSLPRMVSIPNSFVSLFVFYIFSYLLLKRMGCLSRCLVSSTSIQKLFCGSFSVFK